MLFFNGKKILFAAIESKLIFIYNNFIIKIRVKILKLSVVLVELRVCSWLVIDEEKIKGNATFSTYVS